MNNRDQLFYERYAMEDFDERKMKQYAQGFTEDEKKLIAEIRNRNKSFYEKFPYSKVYKNFEPHFKQAPIEAVEKRKPLFSIFKIAVPAFAFLLFITINFWIIQPPKDKLNIKGNAITSLIIYKQTPQAAVLLSNEDQVKPGDLLQIAYRIDSPLYGAIVSLDSKGKMSYHLPLNPEKVPLLEQSNTETLLPYACRLDNTPGYELFLFITSAKPFSLSKTMETIQSMEDPLTSNLKQVTGLNIDKFLLKKNTGKE